MNYNDPMGLFSVSVGGATWSGTDAYQCIQYFVSHWGNQGFGSFVGSGSAIQSVNAACMMASLAAVPIYATSNSAQPPKPECWFEVVGDFHLSIVTNDGSTTTNYEAMPISKSTGDIATPSELMGGAWLNKLTSTFVPRGVTVFYRSETSSKMCDVVASIKAAVLNWKDNSSSYYAPLQNSNTFVSFILTAAQAPIDYLTWVAFELWPGFGWVPSGQ